MAKFTVGKGLDDYIALLGNLEFKSEEIVGHSIYEGAKIVADEIRANIESLPVSANKSGRSGRRNPTQVEKDGLLDGLGVAKMRNDNGNFNVKIGMDGYNADITAKYPKGKPNAMVARSIESGTYFMNRNPFISRAVRSAKAAAEEAMKAEIDKQIAKTMKTNGG